MVPAVMVPHSSLRAPSMTKTSASPTWRWRGNWVRGSMRCMIARRWVAGSSQRSFRLTPGWRSSQGRSLTEMMRDIGGMVAIVVSSFGLPLHVLQSQACRSFSFQMNEAERPRSAAAGSGSEARADAGGSRLQRFVRGVGTATLLPTSSRASFDDTHGRGRAHSSHNAFEVETRCGKKTSKLALCALAPPRRHRKHLEIEQERDLGLAVLRALG